MSSISATCTRPAIAPASRSSAPGWTSTPIIPMPTGSTVWHCAAARPARRTRRAPCAAISPAPGRSCRSAARSATAAPWSARRARQRWSRAGATRSPIWSPPAAPSTAERELERADVAPLLDPVEMDLARWTVARGHLAAAITTRRWRSPAGPPPDRGASCRKCAGPPDSAPGASVGCISRRGTSPSWRRRSRRCRRSGRAPRSGRRGRYLVQMRPQLVNRYLRLAATGRDFYGLLARGILGRSLADGADRDRLRGRRSAGAAALPRRQARDRARPDRPGRPGRAGDPQAGGARRARADGRPRRARQVARPAGRPDAPGAEPRPQRRPLRSERAVPGTELASRQRLYPGPGAGVRVHARRVRVRSDAPKATPAPAA